MSHPAKGVVRQEVADRVVISGEIRRKPPVSSGEPTGVNKASSTI